MFNLFQQLLSVVPCSNSFSLVFKDKETLGYIQYINHRAGLNKYHTIMMMYKEQEQDQELEEEEEEEEEDEN